MAILQGPTKSIWTEFKLFHHFQPLDKNLTTQVCIVGAGIAGLTCAYLLRQEGYSVIVLDDGPIGGGETNRTTAHLSNAIDDRYWQIEKLHGEMGARLAGDSHTQAINKIESIILTEGINCDFERVNGYLFEPPGQSISYLDREFQAANRAGIKIEKISRAPIDKFDTGPALRFANQAQLNPTKYLSALTSIVQKSGVKIFLNTHVTQISGKQNPTVITDQKYTVSAGAVIVATNTPFNDLLVIHTKQAAYRTYVIGVKIPRGSVMKALYWDDTLGGFDPYHFVRVANMPDGEYLIVGGEDHKTGQAHDAQNRFNKLEIWARERFPIMKHVSWQWSGQIMETVDGLAYIGKNPLDHPDIYIATGDSGMGMTHGTIAGILLTDLICGRKNDWEELYNPSRKTLQATLTYARENTNTALQYADWLTKGEIDSLEDLKQGEGAVIRDGPLTKTAVYKDTHGRLHTYSAICPHLDGIVTWNSLEKSWDCPCHGSRFDCYGKVLNGPACVNLTPINYAERKESIPIKTKIEVILPSTH